jgi:hypothetical protein
MKLSLFVLTGTLIFSAQSRAEISVSEAKSELSAVQKFSGSSLEKRLVLQSCKKIEALESLCSGVKLKDLSEAQFQEIKAAVSSSLTQIAASEEENKEKEIAVASSEASGASINVATGDGNVQQQTTTSTPGYMNCIQQVNANISRMVASLNSRGIGKNRVKQ